MEDDRPQSQAAPESGQAQIEARRDEAQAHWDAAFVDLARGVNHDLRAPVRRLKGLAEVLERQLGDQLEGESREVLERMVDNAGRVMGMLNAFVDYGRLIPGSPEWVELDADAVVTRVVDRRREELEALGGQVTQDELPALRTDALLFERLISELLDNALKFLEQGAPRVHVGHADGTWFVQDEGIGLDTDQSERLFRCFGHLHPPDRFPGNGMGLAVCRRIVERLGGRIWVDSEPGQGARFSFTLPQGLQEAVTNTVPSPEPGEQLSSARSGASGRILLAEDDMVIRRVVSTILERQGHVVQVADHGKHAVELWRAGDFDLILMDVHMPEMDGLQATRIIREEEKSSGDTEHTPVVAVTAQAAYQDREACADAGIDGYLSKPFRAPGLLRIVNKYLAMSRGADPDGVGMTPMGPSDAVSPGLSSGHPGAEDPAVFNEEAALAVCQGDGQLFQEVIGIYARDCPPTVERIRQAIADGDSKALAFAAHRLKGMSNSVGGAAVTATAKLLEDMGHREDLAAAPTTLDALDRDLDRLFPRLMDWDGSR